MTPEQAYPINSMDYMEMSEPQYVKYVIEQTAKQKAFDFGYKQARKDLIETLKGMDKTELIFDWIKAQPEFNEVTTKLCTPDGKTLGGK